MNEEHIYSRNYHRYWSCSRRSFGSKGYVESRHISRSLRQMAADIGAAESSITATNYSIPSIAESLNGISSDINHMNKTLAYNAVYAEGKLDEIITIMGATIESDRKFAEQFPSFTPYYEKNAARFRERIKGMSEARDGLRDVALKTLE